MTYATAAGSNLVYMFLDKDGAIEVYLQFMGRRYTGSAIGEYMTLPLFSLFRIVEGDNYSMDNIINQIVALTQHADPSLNGASNADIANRIRQALIPTEAKMSGIANEVVYLTKNTQDPIDVKGGREYLIKRINDTLFSFAKDDLSIFERLYMLLIMASTLLMVKIGVRPEDDKNSWANKRIVTPADQMETLFKAYWIKVMGNLQAEADKSQSSARAIVGHFDPDWLTKRIRKNFSTGKWGVEETNTKDNVTMVLQITNSASTWDELKKVLIPTRDRNTNAALRNNHLSQGGFICPGQTPEGQMCGLVKNMAALATVSMTRDEIMIKNIIRGKFSIRLVNEAGNVTNSQWIKRNWLEAEPTISSLKVMLNGKFLGFSSNELYNYLTYAKRSGQGISFDTSIVKDFDQFLHIYCDSSRPIRPLLIVNTDQTLVINQKNGWDLSIDQMLVSGMLEYVDPHEQEYLNVAQSVDDIQLIKYGQAGLEAEMRQLKDALKRLTTRVEQAEPELASLIRQQQQLNVAIEVASLPQLQTRKDQIVSLINKANIDLDNDIKIITSQVNTKIQKDADDYALAEVKAEQNIRMDKVVNTDSLVKFKIDNFIKTNYKKYISNALVDVYHNHSKYIIPLEQELDDINNKISNIKNYKNVNINIVNIEQLNKVNDKIANINLLIDKARNTKIKLLEKQYLFNKMYIQTTTNSVDGGSNVNTKQRAYYTHCEPDPAGIMSISSNLIVVCIQIKVHVVRSKLR